MDATEERRPSVYELQSRAPTVEGAYEQIEGTPSQELKPADRGRDAWTILIAGVIFEALFWGVFDSLSPL